MKRNLDIEVLRTFVAISEVGSFQGAARIVGRSQAAVTMQIKKLEELVGKTLFMRERPMVRTTRDGDALLQFARRLLRLQDKAFSAMIERETAKSIRFGIPDDFTAGILPKILTQLTSDHPLIEISIVCGTTPELESLISNGELDVALVSRRKGDFVGRFLKDEPIVWAAAKNHLLHHKKVIPLGVFQEDCLIRQNAISVLSKAGLNYRVCFSSPNLAALTAVATSGLAIAAMPISSVPQHLVVLGAADGMPEIPSIELSIILAANDRDVIQDDFIQSVFSIVWNSERIVA